MLPRLAVASSAFALLLAVAAGSTALAAVGPFGTLAGRWAGAGVLTRSDGGTERLQCRAEYTPAQNNLRLNIRCASSSYSIDLVSDVTYSAGTISGQWSETSRNANGTLTGEASGDRIEAVARSDLFSANLSMTTRGRQQSVSIHPQPGSEIAAVSIKMERR
jgi:hypothetical protein